MKKPCHMIVELHDGGTLDFNCDSFSIASGNTEVIFTFNGETQAGIDISWEMVKSIHIEAL